jgi:enoyl-CoA hydratase/carnithine racemase
LARLVGPSQAKELIFSGRFVQADEALRIGLVDEVVDAADVLEAARRRLAPYVGGPAYALRAAKEAVDRGLEVDLDTGLEIERMQFAGLFATRDREIGVASFVEHGPGKARFEGR